MRHFVFVYGTLKKGFPNHCGYMDATQLLGEYQTLGKYPLFLNGKRFSPCVTNEPGKGYHVQGELYEMDDQGLARIDALERINKPDGYRRHTIYVVSLSDAAAKPKPAGIYLMDPEWVRKPQTGYLKVYDLKMAAHYVNRETAQNGF